jgi:hypothetical protein
MVLNKRRDIENGLRALLREVGLKVGTPSRKDFAARVRELAAYKRHMIEADTTETSPRGCANWRPPSPC